MERLVRALMCAWLVGFAATAGAAEPAVPQDLRDWVEWVLDDDDERVCPMLVASDDETSHVCAWPGELAIEAGADGARFTQRWTVYATTPVPLPGDAGHWPQRVTANGNEIPVVPDENGVPVAWLDEGDYALAGRYDWSERPESLALPDSIALVRLSVDGAPVFPLQRDDETLWFGRAETADADADSLALEVFRRVDDGIPAVLTTRIVLNASGEGREETLGKPLPAGFVPIALDGALPAKLESDGTLKVQVRPGSHTLTLVARATAPLAEVVRPALPEPWPADEVWSYADSARLRVTTATAERAIDPAQAGVPSDWAALPAFLLGADEKLVVKERSRGLSAQDENRLVLNRRMWLRFDGSGFDMRDAIDGTMVRDWRLDVAAPYVLERATMAGEGLLVTRGPDPSLSGVEVRARRLDVRAGVRLDAAGGELPIAGWQQEFDAVYATLNLPPSYRLFAALGADAAPGSWIERWNLLDVFLVAITTLLAAWFAGRAVGALVLVYLVLAYHEPGAPMFALLVVIVLALLAKLLPATGRLARALAWIRNAALVVLVLIALPFVAAQVRLALYPQLEQYSPRVAASLDGGYGIIAQNAAPEETVDLVFAEPAAPPPAARVEQDQLESITVVGARIKRTDVETAQPVFQVSRERLKTRYAANTVVQAGTGDPGWNWNVYTLSFSGPVVAEQTVRLLIAPPWFTRALRIVVVLLLAALLAQLARAAFGRSPGWPRAAAAALVAGLALPGIAGAADTPSAEILTELEQRLLEAPECAPRCGHIASAEVLARGDAIRVALSVHAVERVALPVPGEEGSLAPQDIVIDGTSDAKALRRDGGETWIVVPRGVHRVEIAYAASRAGKIALRFPLAPSQVTFEGAGWEAQGLVDARLLTDTLELVRLRDAGDADTDEAAAQQFAPYVRVVRTISLGLDWEVRTEIVRIAPAEAALSVRVPRIAGEQVLTQDLEVAEGAITVPLQAGAYSTTWVSRIERAPIVELTAPDLARHAEVWFVHANETWNARFEGVPPVYPEGEDWIHEFHPLPGETLKVYVARPEPVAGASIAIDGASLATSVGKREVEHTLEATLRSTQGGQHVVTLPADAKVREVSIDGAPINVRPEDGKLGVPVKPGSQRLRVSFRETRDIGFVARTAPVSLGAPASNLDISIALPADRWVLRTSGPRVGPAVLYWGELLVLVLVAVALARLRRAPLKVHEWLLLGIGFSTVSWLALLIVVAWLFALDARCRSDGAKSDLAFNLGQLGLVLLTLLAMTALVPTVRYGLLGTPDMHLVGNGSTPTDLRWFGDRTADAMPIATAWSLPMRLYQVAMLAWALWLATALVRWLKWGWSCWSKGGYWRSRSSADAPVEATTSEGA